MNDLRELHFQKKEEKKGTTKKLRPSEEGPITSQ